MQKAMQEFKKSLVRSFMHKGIEPAQHEGENADPDYDRKGVKGFFRNPKNLKYNLNTIVPLIVFLTTLLALAIGSNILAPLKTQIVWAWIMAACLFTSLCSYVVMRAMTQPINDLVKKAHQYVKLEEMRKERGKLIEVYEVIEKLIEYVRAKGDANEESRLMESIETLNYLIPLGYMSLMVAHEVRNPLTAITGMSELLKLKMTDEAQLRYIETILESARKINDFTGDLLDFTDNDIEREKLDINDVVAEAIDNLAPLLNDVTCVFNRLQPFICYASRNKMYQVIVNILKNAAEYEKDGGYIQIDVSRESGSLVISIFNRHSFIVKEDMEDIFKPFFTKKKRGRGIGLFVAMRNMKLHGGDISVVSGEYGTVFKVRLPLVQEDSDHVEKSKADEKVL